MNNKKKKMTPHNHKEEKCDCEEMSCKEGCMKNHTHKGFSCNVCKPKNPTNFNDVEKAFWGKVRELTNMTHWEGRESETVDFGYKIQVPLKRDAFKDGAELFTVTDYGNILNFFRKVYEEQERRHQEEIKEILKLIEGKKKELHHADGGELSYYKHTMIQGYNQALEELKEEIHKQHETS